MDWIGLLKMSRNKSILFRRRILSLIRIEKSKKKLILHEKYEGVVKWFARIVVVIGIVTSIISMPWYFSLILTLVLLGIECILERTSFMFYTLFIQPIPTSEDLKKANWFANIFGFAQGNVPDKEFLVGLAFKDKEAGEKIFKCISAWNNMEEVDMENNINLSFIIEDNEDYSTYLYPSVNREVIKRFESKIKKNGKQHNKLICTLIMCRTFPNVKKSTFYKFKEEYQNYSLFTLDGVPQKYKPFTLKGFYHHNGKYLPLNSPTIKKFHLKIKNRADLTQNDLEYEHGKFRMNK